MPFIPVLYAAMVEVRMLLDGQKIENTLYVRDAGEAGPVNTQNLANAVLALWTTNIMPVLTTSVQLIEVYVTDLSDQFGPTATAVPSGNVFGGEIQNPVPNNVALCVSFRTQGRGRSSRGRNYVPGLAENQFDRSRALSGLVIDLQNRYAAFGAALNEGGWIHVVVSRYSNKAPRPTGLVQDVTSYVITDNVADSQRRRLPGRGT